MDKHKAEKITRLQNFLEQTNKPSQEILANHKHLLRKTAVSKIIILMVGLLKMKCVICQTKEIAIQA